MNTDYKIKPYKMNTKDEILGISKNRLEEELNFDIRNAFIQELCLDEYDLMALSVKGLSNSELIALTIALKNLFNLNVDKGSRGEIIDSLLTVSKDYWQDIIRETQFIVGRNPLNKDIVKVTEILCKAQNTPGFFSLLVKTFNKQAACEIESQERVKKFKYLHENILTHSIGAAFLC